MTMRIAIGSDHAGFDLKMVIANHLREAQHAVADLGPPRAERCDYPDFAAAVARSVARGEVEVGIVVCGSGIGVSMAANKVDGIRAALAHNATAARLSREHNDANVLCLGSRMVGEVVALDAVDAFLGGTFQGGRHQDRIEKMMALEENA